MSGKSPKSPYSASAAPNGRGTMRAAAGPNLPAEAFHGTRRRRGANANLNPPRRNNIAIQIDPLPSIRNTARTLRQRQADLRRQAALSRRTARRGAIGPMSMLNKLRLRGRSKSRGRSPNRPHTVITMEEDSPSLINVVVDPMNPPNNAVLQINTPPSRPRTPNQSITVVPHTARRPYTRVRVRSRSRTPSRSRSRTPSRSKSK